MKANDKIKIQNRIETVMYANESQIITYESAAKGNWYHPSKVTIIK
jgi:hypothetical protein